MLLGLKDSDNMSCEYEQRSVIPKQTKTRPDQSTKGKNENVLSDGKENGKIETNTLVIQNSGVPDKQIDLEKKKEKENFIIFDDSCVQNGDNSKVFMGSIGSWINDFFNASNKKSHSSQNINSKPVVQVTELEDSEYLKSLNALKGVFRKKLKSETSVHISNGGKMLEVNFDEVSKCGKKTKKRSKSLPVLKSIESFHEFNNVSDIQQTKAERMVCRQDIHPIRRIPFQSFKVNNSQHLNDSNMVREKTNGRRKDRKYSGKWKEQIKVKILQPKTGVGISDENIKLKSNEGSELVKIEEYVFSTPGELSNRLLLNIKDQDKCTQFYKNSIQESKHYVHKKSKSYQNSSRCYTTNSSLIENSCFTDKMNTSQFYTTSSSEMNVGDEILNNKSPQVLKTAIVHNPKKTFFSFPRESSTFLKVQSPKPVLNTRAETTKNEPKSSSEELVKYLMKKIKVNYRPQPLKKKVISLPPVVSSNKNRFMQSATNSLVMSVIAKRENDQFSQKTGPQMSNENKVTKVELVPKSSFPTKNWSLKFTENNVNFGIKKTISQQKLSKNSSYLEDRDKNMDDNYFFEKNTKRLYDEIIKKNLKECNEKYNKRLEVRNTLSKLDVKGCIFDIPKVKKKDQKKKKEKNILESIQSSNLKGTAQNARFQKQHELFKNNLKSLQPNTYPEHLNYGIFNRINENAFESSSSTSLSTELAVINTELQLVPESSNGLSKHESNETEVHKTLDDDLEVLDSLKIHEKQINPLLGSNIVKKHQDKQLLYKDKLYKTKSLQFVKEDSALLESLTDSCSDLQEAKENSKVTTPVCKSLNSVSLNHRYSTNLLHNNNQEKCQSNRTSYQSLTPSFKGSDTCKETEIGEKEGKDKKKEKTSRSIGTGDAPPENLCGFEKTKKPGPNCEKDKVVP